MARDEVDRSRSNGAPDRVEDQFVKLLHAAASLYSWLQPKLPEDLAFYDSGDAVWLASTSHEQEAWFLDETLRPAEIYPTCPTLR